MARTVSGKTERKKRLMIVSLEELPECIRSKSLRDLARNWVGVKVPRD